MSRRKQIVRHVMASEGSTPTQTASKLESDNPVQSAGEHFGVNFALVCERG
jgi:hypothetical protein